MPDSIELKELAIICLEHEKLSIENPLLKQQIISLEELNELYNKTDSIQKLEISTYKDEINSNEKKIKKLKITQTFLGISSIILFILCLL
jgi:hypothetical protein